MSLTASIAILAALVAVLVAGGFYVMRAKGRPEDDDEGEGNDGNKRVS